MVTPPPVTLPPQIQKLTTTEAPPAKTITSPTSTKTVKETETTIQTATKTATNTKLIKKKKLTRKPAKKKTNPTKKQTINHPSGILNNTSKSNKTEPLFNSPPKPETKQSDYPDLTLITIGGIGYLVGSQNDTEELQQKIKEVESERDNYQNNFQQEQQKRKQTETERDNYYFQLINKEKKIIQKLNSELKLNLSEPNLEQVISRIKELITKPDSTPPVSDNDQIETLSKKNQQLQQTILNLQQQLTNSKTPFGEDLSAIKQLDLSSLEQLFPNQLENNFKSQILSATSYQQLVKTRQEFIQKHLQKESSNDLTTLPPANNPTPNLKTERIIWLSLLVASLLTVGGLLIKLKKRQKFEFHHYNFKPKI
jgi:DNA repair exonuclease SbcCD ATPase subunit